MTIFSFLLPFFGLIALGYLAGRLRWTNESGVAGLNSFVIRFAMPCLIIKVIADSSIRDILNWQFLLTYISAELIIYVAAMAVTIGVFKRSLSEAALLGLAAM